MNPHEHPLADLESEWLQMGHMQRAYAGKCGHVVGPRDHRMLLDGSHTAKAFLCDGTAPS